MGATTTATTSCPARVRCAVCSGAGTEPPYCEWCGGFGTVEAWRALEDERAEEAEYRFDVYEMDAPLVALVVGAFVALASGDDFPSDDDVAEEDPADAPLFVTPTVTPARAA